MVARKDRVPISAGRAGDGIPRESWADAVQAAEIGVFVQCLLATMADDETDRLARRRAEKAGRLFRGRVQHLLGRGEEGERIEWWRHLLAAINAASERSLPAKP